MTDINTIPFKDVVSALLDSTKSFPPKFLHRFSDLTEPEISELRKVWLQIIDDHKINLLSDLADIAEVETLVCFDQIGKLGITDPLVSVRLVGVQLLQSSEDYRMAIALIKLMKNDPEENIRAEAAFALGKFIYMGEVEGLSPEKYERILTALFILLRGQDTALVRQKALEAISYSSHEDIPDQITKAFESKEKNWKLSAIVAMGHTADERWSAPVLSLIHSEDWDFQLEAIKAAGELELKDACLPLLRLLKQKQVDPDILHAVIFALAKIGGENVRTELERLLEEAEDDDEAEFIETALEELDFTEEFRADALLDITVPDKDDLDTIIDIEEESDEPDEEKD
jgi:HEAT repeat protein